MSAGVKSGRKANILWIMSDQHRGHAMSCAGDPNLETPNMDRLAAEGIRFPRAYANSPICTPSRATIQTGRYITSHGCLANHMPLLPSAGPQMAEVMREAGYRTCHHGKWHLSGGVGLQHFVSTFFRPGWDDWIGWECMHGMVGQGSYHESYYSQGANADYRRWQIDKFQADWLTDRSIEWLGRQDADQPWFHVLSIETPHNPWDAPANVPAEQYPDFESKDIQWRPNVPEERRIELEQMARGYYAQVKNLDDNIGRILAALEENGQLENTIVFYFSDHGEFMGSHGRMYKSSPLEESVHVPLLVRTPESIGRGSRPGRVSPAYFGLVDLMPTTLGLCGIRVPPSCDGEDLSSLVLGLADNGQEELLIQFERDGFFDRTSPAGFWRALLRDGWMYTVDREVGPKYLFNVTEDPYERNNLVANPGRAAIRKELHDRLVAKTEGIGDDFFLEEKTVGFPGENEARFGTPEPKTSNQQT